MRKLILLLLPLFFGLMAVIQISGCTLIGWGIGAAINKKPQTVEGWQVETVKVGSRISMWMKDGASHDGYFQGVQFQPMGAYIVRYHEWYKRQETGGYIPYPGDEISVTFKSQLTQKGTFEGFDKGVFYLQAEGGETEPLALTDVSSVTVSSQEGCDGEMMVSLSEDRGAPHRTILGLSNKQGKDIRYFYPEDVEQIEKKGSSSASKGLHIGIALDSIVLFAVLITALSNDDQGSISTSACSEYACYSCPFIYSNTDEESVLEGEVLGGAFFEAAQRSDWIPMPQLQENDGLYRVRVANARDETDYIDEVKLVVFDHSRQSRAYASQNGWFYALTDLRGPASAFDFDGSNVASLVSQPDREFWLGDPVHRNPSDPDDLRDGVVLEFPNIAAGHDVVLAMRLKNAPWISSVEQALMELHGEALHDWYDRLNQSEEERGRLMEMLVREAMLQVEVWDGVQWAPNGFVQGMSTLVWGDVAVPVDLEGIQTPTLKVRLSSTAGFWMIDSVQAGYDTDMSVHAETLHPDRAAGQDGIDVRDDLLKEDGRSYAMPSNDYHVDVSFTSIPERREMDRSYFLKVTGYYAPHLSPEGPPNLALLNDITTRPGALGEFALSRLQSAIAERIANDRRIAR